MNFELKKSIELLERTPIVLDYWLRGLPDDWVQSDEGEGTWSVFVVLGHLIHGEKTDWLDRIDIILSDTEDKTFTPFDRFAQLEDNMGKSMDELLDEFKVLRDQNIRQLLELHITDDELDLTGVHPSLGEVELSQLLSSWVVHDLNHVAQISRVMAHQYKEEVGPWKAYLRILN